MFKNIGRGERSPKDVQKGSPRTCFWYIAHDYYFGSCLGVFEHDAVWNIGHCLVLSGYPQPFIDCFRNNLTDRIQRKVEKITSCHCDHTLDFRNTYALNNSFVNIRQERNLQDTRRSVYIILELHCLNR